MCEDHGDRVLFFSGVGLVNVLFSVNLPSTRDGHVSKHEEHSGSNGWFVQLSDKVVCRHPVSGALMILGRADTRQISP